MICKWLTRGVYLEHFFSSRKSDWRLDDCSTQRMRAKSWCWPLLMARSFNQTPARRTFRLRTSGIFSVSNPRCSFLSMHYYPCSLCLEYCPTPLAQPRPTPQQYTPHKGRSMSESLAVPTMPRLQRSINVTEIINRLIDICLQAPSMSLPLENQSRVLLLSLTLCPIFPPCNMYCCLFSITVKLFVFPVRT